MAYTTDQINSALQTTLASNPNVSYQDLWSAAQQYGVSRDALNTSLQAIDAPAYLSLYDQYGGPSFDNVKWDPNYKYDDPNSGSYGTNGLIGLNSGTAQLPAQTTQEFKPQETKFDNPFAYDQQNPYLSQMADTIKGQVNDNLTRNVMPQIASGAQLAGGFGGSRQGVVEANALKDANQGLSNSLTSMYYGDYNNSMNRGLQKYGMDQSYNLGLGQLQLGNRNTDLNQVQLGANLFQNGNTGFMNTGSGVYNLGLTQQQAPWQVSGNLNNTMTPYTGLGSTTGNYAGNPVAGALGGAVAGSQLYNLWNKPSGSGGLISDLKSYGVF